MLGQKSSHLFFLSYNNNNSYYLLSPYVSETTLFFRISSFNFYHNPIKVGAIFIHICSNEEKEARMH